MDRLNLAQRIVLVIALAVALQILGVYIVTLGKGSVFGWTAYAPLTQSLNIPNPGLPIWGRLLVWLGLIGIWTLGAVWMLTSPRRPE